MIRALPSLLLIVSCGYQPVASVRSSVDVAAVSTRVPEPEIAACLTTELRLGLAATDPRGNATTYRLEALLVDSTSGPGTVSRVRGEVGAVDQVTTLTVRARLVHGERGVVWGPRRYQMQRRANEASNASPASAASHQALERSCREIAAQIIDDITFHLVEERERPADDH